MARSVRHQHQRKRKSKIMKIEGKTKISAWRRRQANEGERASANRSISWAKEIETRTRRTLAQRRHWHQHARNAAAATPRSARCTRCRRASFARRCRVRVPRARHRAAYRSDVALYAVRGMLRAWRAPRSDARPRRYRATWRRVITLLLAVIIPHAAAPAWHIAFGGNGCLAFSLVPS